MKIVAYIAAPYANASHWVMQCNAHEARRVARLIWKAGIAALCPHANSGGMGGVDLPEKVFLEGCIELMLRCDLAIFLPGWKESAGCREEHARALAAGLTVIEWDEAVDPEGLRKLALTAQFEMRSVGMPPGVN